MYEYIEVWVKDNDICLTEKDGYVHQQWLGYKKEDGSIIWAGDYQALRDQAYNNLDINKQLDAIYQGFKVLKDNNVVTLSDDTNNWITSISDIKNNIPVPPDNVPYIK